MIDSVKISGEYRITNKRTGETVGVHNIVTDGGLANIAALLAGNGGAYAWLALGDSDTAVAVTDTALGNETFRTAMTEASSTGAVCTAVFDIFPSEAVATHKEIGVFVGGTSTADSGTLVSHALSTFTKTADEEYLISYIFTIARAS